MRSALVSILLALTLPAAARTAAQKITTWGSAHRTVRYEYRLMNPTASAAMNIEVFLPLPLASPRQEIRYLHLSRKGLERVFTDVHGQRLARYAFERLEANQWVEVGFVAGVTLRNLRWVSPGAHAAKGGSDLAAGVRKRYLRPLPNYSMRSPFMRKTAADLTRGAQSDFEKLLRIHDHIVEKIRYVRDSRWDPAAVVLARGTGSCSEYNYVLSGLCRLAGLPTRYVGGSTNGLRSLPTTDVVFHRWTEVYLTGLGWFSVDCSRDANPVRGKRSHFGRIYTDALVWCRQAGGGKDHLGWDYRAEYRIQGKNPGLRDNHRTRWFDFHPAKEVNAGYAWFLRDAPKTPPPDVLECALVRWHEAGLENRMKLIQALAAAGRNACLRRAATLPEKFRTKWVRKLCASGTLADTILEKSRNLSRLRSWFRSRESRLKPTGKGRFTLARKPAGKREVATTKAPAAEIWANLSSRVVDRLLRSRTVPDKGTVAVMPLLDRTRGGLGELRTPVHAALKAWVGKTLQVRLVDEAHFNRDLEKNGPGRGEFWALALDERRGKGSWPDCVLVPVCITETAGLTWSRTRFCLEVRGLVLETCRTFKVQARAIRLSTSSPEDPDVLVAAGDTVLARWEHDLVSRHGVDWPLAGVRNILSSADAALCNLECCVSLGGRPAKKGERCPFYYRARPEMLQCLTRAGIDIVTAANNHGGDYGPESVKDTGLWCDRAGLVCVGNGDTEARAETPRLVRIGRTRVGIAGLDTTMRYFRADENRPGTNHAPEDKGLEIFKRKMRSMGKWAAGRCDILILTIHWGRNWVRDTQPIHRTMARIAFRSGVDVILGHSAHRLQGMEVMDGKVVVYDMGNLLFDCKLKPEGRQSALFRLHLSRRGVHRIEVIPVLAQLGRTVLADPKSAQAILAGMESLCAALGTSLENRIDDAGRPVGVLEIPEPKVTRRRPADRNLACTVFPAVKTFALPGATAPVVKGIPEDAVEVDPPAKPAPGVELLAYRLPRTARERGILTLATWWRVTGPVRDHVMPAFHLDTGGKTARRGRPWYTRHDPGDWTLPFSRVEKDVIVEDIYPARLAGLPPGPCTVKVVVLDTTRPEGKRILGPACTLGTVRIMPRVKK